MVMKLDKPDCFGISSCSMSILWEADIYIEENSVRIVMDNNNIHQREANVLRSAVCWQSL